MNTQELLNEAKSLTDLASKPEGPETKEQTLMMAQAYALIAIAQELKQVNNSLRSIESEFIAK